MAIPSVKEILKEQKDLEKYKQQIDSFRAMENKSFELPFSVKDLNKTQDSCKDILGCNHLSVDEITEAF
ncbi:hypothetical protein NQ314_012780 [Rhamnusium bicolor]|uniref:Uncharacterized protein n=1 Tax=Rhamnusium bicolor TaxID=1586634 RepID=A0AAV8X971_9CUCU|nr:hypothetical protein NQ314_012780 [Rhamnusium bicolor]